MAQASVVRPSVVRPETQVSQKPLHGSRPNFMGSYLSTISPDHFFVFSKFSIFKFLRIFFVFVNMGLYGSKNLGLGVLQCTYVGYF